MLKALVVILAVASLTSAFPNHWRDSTYMKEIRLQQNTDEECEKQLPLTPKKVCHSVTATDAHGKTKYVHVCPLYDKGEYNKICFVGSAVTRCCTNPKEEFEKRGLRKISETRMSVLENNVNATIYKNEEDVPCVLFEPRGDIRSCCEGEDRPLPCPLTETEPPTTTEPPPLPPCKSKGDLYFILDTTASMYQELFCQLTYVVQQIVIAVKAADVQTRIGGVTFEYVSSSGIDDVYEIFKVKDQCQAVVEEKLPKLISQYYLAYDNNVQAKTPWVRVRKTEVLESLKKVKGLIEEQSKDRRVSVVTLTDGKIDDTDDEITTEVNNLSGLTDGIVLIAGGINIPENSDAAKMLRRVTGGKNTNVVIVKSKGTDDVKKFAKGIVNKMKDNNVLCETEADTINKAMDDKFDKDITNYCATDCVFNENYSTCEHLPKCGQSRAILSGDTSMLSASEELEKEILKEEIYAAVDKVIESDFGIQLQHKDEDAQYFLTSDE